jgi:hypothetical protein
MRHSLIDNALMNTLPPDWRPVITDRPSFLRQGTTRGTVSTSWRACPLSIAWDRAITRGDHRLLRCVDRVAAQWSRVVHRTPVQWLRRVHRARVQYAADDYAAVTAALGTEVLERTLTHITSLRRLPRRRRGLHAIALLERVETAVDTELQVRRAPAKGSHTRSIR